MKKIAILMALALAGLSFAGSVIQPTRVGPVSQYGQLQAGKNSSGKGRIYGACKGVSDGNEVEIQGMSLFWSMAGVNNNLNEGWPYWKAEYVNELVSRHNIQLIRAPMGVDSAWKNSPHYFKNDSIQRFQQGLMDEVVEAAIKNDIYVIIDYHSHTADTAVEKAKTFFSRMAEKWGSYDNVIFEIFNEPIEQSWSKIKTYADTVIKVIRDKGSDNLIVVGNPSWSSRPDEAVGTQNKINDNNVAYTFHFYAGVDVKKDENNQTIEVKHERDREGSHAVTAMNNGLSVFVTEWGASGPSGGGTFYDYRTQDWYDWMKLHKLSGANWAVSSKNEAASYFSGNVVATGTWTYTTGGNWVNANIFADLPGYNGYSACSGTPSSSNSNSSSSTYSSSSSSFVPSVVTLMEDFQDGNVTAETLEDGVWFLYDTKAGKISNTKNANGSWDMIRSSGSSKFASMEEISLIPTSEEQYPSVGMGVSFAEASLANCSAIQYDYKGSGHFFRADISTVTPKKGYEHQTEEQESSTSWKTVTVYAGNLDQPDWVHADFPNEIKPFNWSKVYQLAWFVSMDVESRGTSLQIDNVKCVGTLPEVELPSSSSTKQSSSSTTLFSSSAIVVVGPSIDDFEDGDGLARTGGEDDYWYAFTDEKNRHPGMSTIDNQTNSKGKYIVVFPAAAAGGSQYGAGLTGISLMDGPTFDEYDQPSVALGLNIEEGLAGCTEISYKYKGAGHNLKAVMAGDELGDLTEYNYHKASVDGSISWSTASVPVSSLEQEEDWGKTKKLNISNVVKLQWEVKGTASSDYLYIDDVHCEGFVAKVISSSSGSNVNSSASSNLTSSGSSSDSETVLSSSDANSIVDSGDSNGNGGKAGNNDDLDDDDMAIGFAAAPAGLMATVQGNTLQVTVARAGLVKVHVFDMMGHAIERHSENMAAGTFAHDFAKLNKGAYIVRVQQGSMVKTIRMQVR